MQPSGPVTEHASVPEVEMAAAPKYVIWQWRHPGSYTDLHAIVLTLTYDPLNQ